MSSTIPKAVLYYSPQSVWSAAALLALAEKGYGHDEVDLKIVDLAKGENFAPSFLRLSAKANVPALVVPLRKTLASDVESRYKAVADPKALVEFLDKSRSAISHTHTTSAAPAPALAPATIAFSTLSAKIIDTLHSDAASPDTLLYTNARDAASLRALAPVVLPSLRGRALALAGYLKQNETEDIRVSKKVQAFWEDKLAAVQALLDVFENADKENDALKYYFANAAHVWGEPLHAILRQLSVDIVGPYVLGDQFSLVDIHLAAWLAHLVALSGGDASDDGATAIGKLEAHAGIALPKDAAVQDSAQRPDAPQQSKLAVFWTAVKEKPSWQKVYSEGLY
ncbi:hypothetical protein PLICRDRAFT_144201 [Plicaturopsis crispa FD-325 SS-3]|nr:hypothetical protein PLICRDRAFT_144201 [Plicaturopsis crispa FD-325 SS-3]